MQGLPRDGQNIYEIAIYNREVRSLVKENQHHQFFDDYWADPQIRDICAESEAEARALITKRYPPDDGFVIERVAAG